MRKVLAGIIVLLVIVLLIIFFLPTKKESLPKAGEEAVVAFTKEEVASLQKTLHDDGIGFIHAMYGLDANRYLFATRQRAVDYGKDFPADGLVWVEKTKKGMDVTPLTTGEYPIRLVMNQKRPYFTQDGVFHFVFYEAQGVQELPRNGKGYVYRVQKESGVKKVYETKGTYHHFALDKQNRMVVVERFELENRNMYPRYFAPYELKYQQYGQGKWKTIQEKKVTPDLQEEYEKYEEKYNKK